MKLLSYLFLVVLLALPFSAFANPPLKVIYSQTQTTQFKWQWPYQTARTTTYVQTKPYFYAGRLLNLSQENLSKYRYYYSQNTYKKPWGYFFPPGAKLGSKAVLGFNPIRPAYQVVVTNPPR